MSSRALSNKKDRDVGCICLEICITTGKPQQVEANNQKVMRLFYVPGTYIVAGDIVRTV